jgi:tetratricopeptide (TPR) repeat protein
LPVVWCVVNRATRALMRSLGVATLFLTVLAPARAPLGAQRQQEFTQQGLLVATFKSADRKLGNKVADEIRGRVGKAGNKRDLEVIDEKSMTTALFNAGFPAEMVPDLTQVRALSRYLRADEYLMGNVDKTPAGYRVSARLILARDVRMQQPLPDMIDPDADRAAARMAAAVTEARRQLTPQRRCENHLREGRASQAVEAAREGVRLYPRSTLARRCMLAAHLAVGTAADTVLGDVSDMLRVDSASFYALEGAATAYDVLKNKDRAGEMWLRLQALDTTDIALGERVVSALLYDGNSLKAEPLVARLSNAAPDHMGLMRLRWQVLFANKSWKEATRVGGILLATDSLSVKDSTFMLRLATAYKSNGEGVRAVEVAARGLQAFPKDPRIFSTYVQLVRGEAVEGLTRGLAAFPQNAEFKIMQSQDLKTRGKAEESVDVMREALALDSTIQHGHIQLARAQAELGQNDSAFATLKRALTVGEDSALIAQFALARGNQLYQAANRTKMRPDYMLAMRFLSLADSVQNSARAKLLMGAAALSVAQSAATEAPKTKDCELSRLGFDMLAIAQPNLAAGVEVAAEAVKQYQDYLTQLQPISAKQVEVFCKATTGADSVPKSP